MNAGFEFSDLLVTAFWSLAVIAAGVVPFYLATQLDLKNRLDPDRLKQAGIVVKSLEALDAVSEIAGQYSGQQIYRYVVFLGSQYDFDRIVPIRYKRFLKKNELYMEPGILYIAR